MRLEISIELDNAAFEGDWTEEAARILRDLAGRIDLNTLGVSLRDVNGNTVGRAVVHY